MDRTAASTRSAVAAAIGVAAAVIDRAAGRLDVRARGRVRHRRHPVPRHHLAVDRPDGPGLDRRARHPGGPDPPDDPARSSWAAAVASLAGVGTLLLGTTSGANRAGAAVLGLGSVAIAWLVVHSLFTLHYAELYYGPGGGDPAAPGAGKQGGIDFALDTPPQYSDFAYLAFTIGMTYQLSDTPLTTRPLRMSVLRHALLSYLFGSLILGASVNLVVSLAS